MWFVQHRRYKLSVPLIIHQFVFLIHGQGQAGIAGHLAGIVVVKAISWGWFSVYT